MADKFDYFVQVEEIRPLSGGHKFAAKVPYIVKNPGDNFEQVYPPFREWWGRTREEAETKAKAEADEWIAQQLGNDD